MHAQSQDFIILTKISPMRSKLDKAKSDPNRHLDPSGKISLFLVVVQFLDYKVGSHRHTDTTCKEIVEDEVNKEKAELSDRKTKMSPHQ
jgi:hypothetical protein